IETTPALAIGEITPTPLPEETTPEAFNAQALIESALQDLSDGNWRSAVSKMDEVLAVESDNVEAYLIRGVAYSRLGRLSLAEDDFTAAIDLEPYNWQLYIFRGDTYSAQGDNTGALLDYDRSIEVYWLNDSAYSRRADLYFQLGDTEAGGVDDLISRALAAYQFGDLQVARDFLEEAANSGDDIPAVANAYMILGLVYQSLGDESASLEAYNRAEELNPDMHMIYLGRGILYREMGDIQEAGADFAQRMDLLGVDFPTEEASIGDTLEIEMAYRRVVRITFEGELGQTVTLTARDSQTTATDPLIALLGPDGEPIAGDDDFGGNLDSQIAEFELPANGTYTLLVSHAEGGYDSGFEGVVTVSIEN
ncbi:MAG: tetratricopeptide repeat protein, partial [Anaerolineae bacterium]|nr:tetratricopeptide repeat protein [Anaerolineae bacterium]